MKLVPTQPTSCSFNRCSAFTNFLLILPSVMDSVAQLKGSHDPYLSHDSQVDELSAVISGLELWRIHVFPVNRLDSRLTMHKVAG